jgi:hypothetical protein
MFDPFKLLGKLFVAAFVICGYFVVFLVQVVWYLASRRPDKVGDAVGYMGRGITDAIANIFRR